MRPGFRCARDLVLGLVLAAVAVTPLYAGTLASAVQTGDASLWWVRPLILFGVTFLIGILAVLGGVGGGVLFVPIVSGFFPIHLDFVRAAGLLMALCGSLSAGPGLLRANLASLRLAVPMGLIASICAMLGAMIGLALPTNIVQVCLGVAILGICGVMLAARKSVVE